MRLPKLLLTVVAHLFLYTLAGAEDKPLGKVIAINTKWNFVLVDVGRENGINPKATLVVQASNGETLSSRIIEVDSTSTVLGFDDVGTLKIGDAVTLQVNPGKQPNKPALDNS